MKWKSKYGMQDVIEDNIEELYFKQNKIHAKNKRKEKLVGQRNSTKYK